MRRIRKTQTTVETREMVILHGSGGGVEAPCPQCGRMVRMLPPEEAAGIAGVSVRTIYRWLEERRLHFWETSTGALLVCVISLGGSLAGTAGSQERKGK